MGAVQPPRLRPRAAEAAVMAAVEARQRPEASDVLNSGGGCAAYAL